MSLPEAASPSAPARKPRRIRAVVLIGLLLSAAGTLIAIKLRSPMPAVGGATNQVANPAEAVALNAFVQPETRRWRGIPQGTQVCDNVTFICTGALRIAGLQAARDGNRYPGAVLGVPVDRRGTRLHLLQAAENAAEMIEGEAYARLVLHYANGEIRKLDLLFGIHGDDWFQNEADPNDVVADPNSKPAWIHRRKGDGKIIRIYHTIL